MNRYPLWKYLTLLVALIIGLVYTLPNFYGEAPAVQLSSGKATTKFSPDWELRVRQALDVAGIKPDLLQSDGHSVKVRFADADTQLKAKDTLEREFNPTKGDPHFIVALNLLPRTPMWLTRLRLLFLPPKPMYLGLDLRGGVHFLMQLDMKAVVDKRADTWLSDVRNLMREKNIRISGISRSDTSITVALRDQESQEAALLALSRQPSEIQWSRAPSMATEASQEFKLLGTFKPEALRQVQNAALKQNITTLHNRVNELGVAEPLIQQQGLDRIVIQLPGVQDTAKAKDIIGRTANLEFRLVDTSAEARAALESNGPPPAGRDKFSVGVGGPVITLRNVIANGEMLSDAHFSTDRNNLPAVSVSLDAKGGRQMRDTTRLNIGKPMAAILFEKGKGELLTVATIQGEFGSEFQITGMGTPERAHDLALLLRAGSLAAPMEIIEERTIGPTLGAENISKGFASVTYGFVAIAIFMCVYYMLFGVFSTIALAFNLLLLVAFLSLLQATLTLPGIAAIALTLGMAIDANVLINERIREELRQGVPPQTAIHLGYDRAFATILDSNITTLIAGVALLAFGSGPVRGFAVVHCLGILTSMFSAVMFSRGLVNLWYGRQKKLKNVSIGQVWRLESSPRESVAS